MSIVISITTIRWSQFRGGIEELEERTDNEHLTDWAARLEEEMRPPLARLGDRFPSN